MYKLPPIFASSVLFLISATAQAATLDGSTLSLWWGAPFALILLSIAIFPIIAPHFWHLHFGKVTAVWTMLFLVPFVFYFGIDTGIYTVAHALIEEYIPFILLLLALFTISGGILVWGNLHGCPKTNVTILAIGTLLASIMGTTGAAMLLIRPLLKANDNRKHRVHTVIFFIFLVANIGGGLTPLGDPPLFLGFLKGVSFFWTLEHMLLPVIISSVILLTAFYFLDRYYYSKEDEIERDPTPDSGIKIFGKWNFLLLIGVIAAVLLSGIWKTNASISILGNHISMPALARDLVLIVLTIISLKITPKQVRAGNEFNWFPIKEVGKLFLGIFITITPVIAILKAGEAGHFHGLIQLAHNENGQAINSVYFWLTGILSAFLDNAPTYLVFFNLAGGDPVSLMNEMSTTLLAISMGSVFMGALSYIGNAPNFMVKSIAEQRKVTMPSFFGYLVWSCAILIPVLIIQMIIFFL